MSELDGAKTELLRLRDLTARTGVLHPAQVLQIKMWAAILSPTKGSFEVQVDPDDRNIVFEFRRLNKKYHQGHPQALARSVRWLLGASWVIQVKSAGKTIFAGRRSIPLVKREEPVQEHTPWRDLLHSSPSGSSSLS